MFTAQTINSQYLGVFKQFFAFLKSKIVATWNETNVKFLNRYNLEWTELKSWQIGTPRP
jgi:hypothetical protein